MTILIYLAVAAAIVAGLARLGRAREISEADYEEMKGKGSRLGNALLDAQVLLEPGKEPLRRAKEVRNVAQDDEGDPPEAGS